MHKAKQLQTKEVLSNIINETFNINISSQSRKREHVQGRMIYYKILRDLGYGLSYIAKSINKNHATVIHGLKQFQDLWEVEPEVRFEYNLIRDLFYNLDVQNTEDVLKKSAVFKHLKSLENQNKSLTLEVQALKNSLKKVHRYNDLIDLLNQRTLSKEQLDRTRIRLNAFLNGL
jgi:hypothetical protein